MRSRGGGDPQVGCVQYLNARPLIHGWPGPVLFDHPAALCRKLSAGELDIALVSSFEYLRNPEYTIVDDVAIAADGPVYSVIVAHRVPLETVDEIALDPASETSVHLLRCLLERRNLRPRLMAGAPNGSDQSRLMIGDQAIRFRREHTEGWEFWDLGAAWKEVTGLPFVFALWLIRPAVSDASETANALRLLRDRNLTALDLLIAEEKNFAPEFCRRYFTEYLRFGFGRREKEGLMLFRSECQKHGILPPRESELRLA